jgi:hypothetical protein
MSRSRHAHVQVQTQAQGGQRLWKAVQLAYSSCHGCHPQAIPCGTAATAVRGVNTLRFQIARESSTAISTCQPTPPPAVPLWTLEFQPRGPCGSPARSWLAPLASAGPALPAATCPAWEGRVLCWAACTRSASSTSFSDHRRLITA